MTLIRHRQRVVTAISPHNANRRYIVPKRTRGPQAVAGQQYSVTAGVAGPSQGYVRPNIGALDPDVPLTVSGQVIQFVLSVTSTMTFDFRLAGLSVPNVDETFSRINVQGEFDVGFNTFGVERAAMTYNPDNGGNSAWTLAPVGGTFISGNTYTLGIEQTGLASVDAPSGLSVQGLSMNRIRVNGPPLPDAPEAVQVFVDGELAAEDDMLPVTVVGVASGVHTVHIRGQYAGQAGAWYGPASVVVP